MPTPAQVPNDARTRSDRDQIVVEHVGFMIHLQVWRSVGVTGGRLTPDLWMTRATGSPVGPRALLEAAAKALETLKP